MFPFTRTPADPGVYHDPCYSCHQQDTNDEGVGAVNSGGRSRCMSRYGRSVVVNTVTVHLMVIMLCLQRADSNGGLTGTSQMCDLPNGSAVSITGISSLPCISCFCQDGVVECSHEKCFSRGECPYIPRQMPKHQCCPCKGCIHKGKFHEHGEKWTNPKKLCKEYVCEAGVVTGYKMECHVICKHPVFPNNTCCPVCEGCRVNGVTYKNLESFPSPRDPGATCTCQNGTVMCVRRACPVLNCQEHQQLSKPGSCPQCAQSRRFYVPPRGCLFRRDILGNKKRISPEPCSNCTCVRGTVVCVRRVCPVLHCASNDVIKTPSDCCPKCKRKKKPCHLNGKSYKHGATWWPDECTSCDCDDNTVRCHVQQCPNHVACPKGQRLSHIRGKCCAVCVDSDAVCAVFGDPHYRTFDGRIYNFQGMCRYVLAQDCHSKNFSIRVRNRARLTNYFAWTTSVTVILMKDLRISLHQNLKVKVNGRVTSLPYEKPHVVGVVKGGGTVTLKTTFGLKVIWDGNSYLEVTVPPWMKNKMCGLCGNYNGIQGDDFIGKGGGLYFDANEFAETWRLGKGRTCGGSKKKPSLKVLRQQSLCDNNLRRRRQAERDCSILHSLAFTSCRAKVDVGPYYMSCVVDVCDCPSDRSCSCEAIMAYSRQCTREGVHVAWRTPSVCGALPCQKGAVFNICASACPRTCANVNEPTSCGKPCRPACQCAPGRVLRGHRCVTEDRCQHRRRTIEGLLGRS